MYGVAMASFKHQGLCKLLGERPGFVPVLLQTLLGMKLPSNVVIVPAPETIRELGLPEHAADVVVAHRRATSRRLNEAFVFEVQLRPDRDKWWSWPVHLCGTRARHRCPTTLVVITTNERTARWAAAPIDFGRTQGMLRPLVIGPQQIPRMLELHEARACPELATLAVIVHGHHPGSKRLGRNALEAVLERLAKRRERDRLLLELILGSLPAGTLREIEDEMDVHATPLLSKWSKQRIAEGRALGKREGLQKGLQKGLQQGRRDGRQEGQHEGRQRALLLVLRSRGLAPKPTQLRRIGICTDSRQLDAWLRRAAVVQRVEELFERRASR
jgi:hypothetical protein